MYWDLIVTKGTLLPTTLLHVQRTYYSQRCRFILTVTEETCNSNTEGNNNSNDFKHCSYMCFQMGHGAYPTSHSRGLKQLGCETDPTHTHQVPAIPQLPHMPYLTITHIQLWDLVTELKKVT